MSHYPHYPSQSSGGYHHPVSTYGFPYGGTSTAYSTGHPPSVASSLMPFSLSSSAPSPHNYHTQSQYAGSSHHPSQAFDTSGQVAPVNSGRPRLSATLWEDEGTLCFQIEARGVTVARREDNNYINGTKLLNVAGMTRGRRDGILKSEKNRNVVKIGPMHLKGVWVPYEKALEYANKEKITDILYPLFVQEIGELAQTCAAPNDSLRSLDPAKLSSRIKTSLSVLSSMPSHLAQGSVNAGNQVRSNRPPVERAQTFPTPPTSASSMTGNPNNSYDWGNQNIANLVQSVPPLAVDNGSSTSRSLPNTPASTPPGNTIQATQPYHAPSTMNQYSMQPGMSRYGGQSSPYIKSEMRPPSKSLTKFEEIDQNDIKQDPYNSNPGENQDSSHDDSYSRVGGYTNYNPVVETSTTSTDQINGSPQPPASVRGTPRNSLNAQQWSSGYNTPSRSNSTGYTDNSAPPTYSSNSYPASGYPSGGMSIKRAREDDENEYKPSPRCLVGNGTDSIKRRRADAETSVSSTTLSGYDQGRLSNGNSVLPARMRS